MHTCVVCQAFPGHTGPHYSLREVRNLQFAGRRRSLSPGEGIPLAGSLTPEGAGLVFSASTPRSPEAVHVQGIWLIPSRIR